MLGSVVGPGPAGGGTLVADGVLVNDLLVREGDALFIEFVLGS